MHTTPPPRSGTAGFAIAVLGIVVLTVTQRVGAALVALGLIIMMFAGSTSVLRTLLAHARSEWIDIFHVLRVRRRLWRRRAELVTAPSPTVELAWQMLSVVFVLILLGPGLGFPIDGLVAAMNTSATLGFTVALFDLVFMGMVVMRWSWGRSAGKWVKGALAAVVAATALALARQSVTGFTGEDPTKLPTFLTFVSIAHLPMAWASTAAVVGTFALVPALIRRLARVMREANRDRFRVLTLSLCARALRPIFVCGALLQIGLLSTPLNLTSSPLVHKVAAAIMINADFFEQATCDGHRELAARMGDGRYLVADRVEPLYFRGVSCPLAH